MKKIRTALISVYYKDGLENIIHLLHKHNVKIFSTGGTREFITALGVPSVAVEDLTGYPSILGGRVKTLHPVLFGGILGRIELARDREEMNQYGIPEIDLVIVDLYPFSETLASEKSKQVASGGLLNDKSIIEKIDIGGPSMIRAAAKNHEYVTVVASKKDYSLLTHLLEEQEARTSLEQRRVFAAKAFDVCTEYDNAISNYFNHTQFETPFNKDRYPLRYGENPHQQASFYGNFSDIFTQLHGKELSYNNLVDVDAAIQLIREFNETCFAIIKHTNVCGIAQGNTLADAWSLALAGDPESAFGGVLICNHPVDAKTASAINEQFFEVLIAPAFEEDGLTVLKSKKNRILLQLSANALPDFTYKSLLNGIIQQQADLVQQAIWNEVGGRIADEREKRDMVFANIVCKHLKSNAIAIVKDLQLLGKGCGQTSRVDAMRQALDKAIHYGFDLKAAVVSSDAFFPFDDCVKLGHVYGICCYIQPGGSIRDKDSIDYAVKNDLVMILTGSRHFKH